MNLVVYGLTLTSSWGNGHATTYRSLLKALHRRGHTVTFVEKDVEWYRSNRDLPQPRLLQGPSLRPTGATDRPALLALAKQPQTPSS